MKKILITGFLCVGGILFAQTIDYHPNRDPISGTENFPGVKMLPSSKETNFCLCCNKDAKIKPLIILNGKEISKDEFENVDSQKIKSIEVLKETKAIELYGEKAKNGVIIIKAKKNWRPKKIKMKKKDLIAR